MTFQLLDPTSQGGRAGTTFAEDDATWSVTAATGVAATGVINGLLRILVTGGTGDMVHWVASVRTAELRF